MTKKKTICIIPLCNQGAFIRNRLPALEVLEEIDLCIVDDGSTDGSAALLEELDGIVSIQHETAFGYGAALNTGYDYARDLGYERIIVINADNDDAEEDIKMMIENLDYGYDLISCSRVLENKQTETMSAEAITITDAIGDKVAEIAKLDITDPLSGIFAVEIQALEAMELTDETHGYLLQLWIQSAYYKLTIMEIPAASGESFGSELEGYEDALGFFLSILETERYLYPDKTIN